jgi:hypothetical protein
MILIFLFSLQPDIKVIGPFGGHMFVPGQKKTLFFSYFINEIRCKSLKKVGHIQSLEPQKSWYLDLG